MTYAAQTIMNAPGFSLMLLLRAAATLQLAVAVMNLFLVPLLKWKEVVARMPLLLREVFQVHAWFIETALRQAAVLPFRKKAE